MRLCSLISIGSSGLSVVVAGAVVIACTSFKDDMSGDAGEAMAISGDGEIPVPAVDGAATDTALQPCDTTAPFGAPTLVPGLSNVVGEPFLALRLSPDYLTAYFAANMNPNSGGSTGLYTATRPTPTAPFSGITPLAQAAEAPTDYETEPTVSPDGLTLIFGRAGAGDATGHVSYATRASLSSPFVYVGLLPDVNEPSAADGTPFLREDGEVLYFSSTRIAGDDQDIFRALSNGSGFDGPTAVTELNTTFADGFPVVTPDDLTLFFASTRPGDGAQGDFDIWTATRASTSEAFSTPTNVVELNTADADYPTFVTRDGCALYLYVEARAPNGVHSVFVANRPVR
jgi:hypothetical protein